MTPDPHRPLRDDVSMLGEMLGDTLREREGNALFETVEGSDNLAMGATIVVGFRFIAPNQRRPPLNDPALRRAMAAASSRTIRSTTAGPSGR